MKATTKRKKRGELPQLCRKKNRNGRDTAYGTFNGCRVWFGHWGEPETRAEFDAYLARWLANGRRPLDEPEDVEGLTVGDLVECYRQHLDEKHDDAWQRNNEARVTGALDPLARLFGTEPAGDFGPRKLVAVRVAMIQSGKLVGPSTPSTGTPTILPLIGGPTSRSVAFVTFILTLLVVFAFATSTSTSSAPRIELDP